MITVNVQEAKTRLSELLKAVEQGESVVIARAGRAVAELRPVNAVPPRTFGGLSMVVPDDFDEPLPAAELAAWE